MKSKSLSYVMHTIVVHHVQAPLKAHTVIVLSDEGKGVLRLNSYFHQHDSAWYEKICKLLWHGSDDIVNVDDVEGQAPREAIEAALRPALNPPIDEHKWVFPHYVLSDFLIMPGSIVDDVDPALLSDKLSKALGDIACVCAAAHIEHSCPREQILLKAVKPIHRVL